MTSHPRHVLLVEDDAAHAKLLIHELAAGLSSVTVARVADGEAALAYVYHQEPYTNAPRPDLILLDLRLPRIGGHEVLRRLKDDPDLQMIPVVMLTTSDSTQDVIEAYRHRANSYVVKPLDYARYKDMVRDLNAFWAEWNLTPADVTH